MGSFLRIIVSGFDLVVAHMRSADRFPVRRDRFEVGGSLLRSVAANGSDSLGTFVPRLLELTLQRAEREHDAREQAWILRDGIDLAWLDLREIASRASTDRSGD